MIRPSFPNAWKHWDSRDSALLFFHYKGVLLLKTGKFGLLHQALKARRMLDFILLLSLLSCSELSDFLAYSFSLLIYIRPDSI